MKEKIINIKNILKIVISLFIIFSMAKSCAKAKTYPSSSLIEEINTNIQKIANYYEIEYFPIYNTTGNIMYENTTNYCIFVTESNSGWQANTIGAFFPQNATLQPTYNGSQYLNNIQTTIMKTNSNTSIGISDWAVTKSAKFKYMYTQFDWATSTGFNYQANNEYGAEIIFAPLVNISFGHMFSETITYSGEEMQANELDYNYRIEFIENVITEDNEITSMQATLDTLNLECQDLGSYWTLKCNNSTLLKYNKVYNLNVTAIVNGNEEEIEEKILFVPPGTTISGGVITNIPSGDYNFNTENATNQIIDNQNQNQSWLEQTYNNLFVLDSGDVNNILNDLENKMQISNIGDLSGEKAILETLTGEPGDFVIAWNTTEYMNKTIIPSGEINFSQKVREVPALKTTQDWLRIIMGYSVTIVLLSEIFFTILKVIGVSVSIYEQHEEEIERLEEMHTPKVYKTEVSTPKGIKRYYTRRTRIK